MHTSNRFWRLVGNRQLANAIARSIWWYPLALFILFMKYTFIQTKYFPLLFISSDIPDEPGFIDYFWLYKSDILFCFVTVPLILIIFFWKVRSKALIALLYVTTLIFAFFLYANMHSWGTIGRSLTLPGAIDAVTFAWENPAFVDLYIDTGSRIKFGLFLIATTSLYFAGSMLTRSRLISAQLVIFVLLTFAVSVPLAIAGQTSTMQSRPITGNFVAMLVRDFPHQDVQTSDAIAKLTPTELMKTFDDFSNTSRAQSTDRLYGSSEGNDVIFFVMETGSADFIDLDADIESFPTMQSLQPHSLVATNHYSTFPASTESLFSIFVSLYPPRNFYNTCVTSWDGQTSQRFPGIISKLEQLGYETALYIPFRNTLPMDKVLHENLGFKKTYIAQNHDDVLGAGKDLLALETMIEDIGRWIASGEQYAVVFLPQIGHAPWPARPDNVTIHDYGRQMAQEQDKWLGRIIAALRKSGKLQSTTIVVTADHGIRTSQEDPQFDSGFVDAYSFHVPLLVYSYPSFRDSQQIQYMTSHVDISPSIESLLGIDTPASPGQGIPLWDGGQNHRTTFFLGNWYFGADAFAKSNRFFMYSQILDLAFAGNRLEFNSSGRLPSVQESSRIAAVVNNLYAIQSAWVTRFVCHQH